MKTKISFNVKLMIFIFTIILGSFVLSFIKVQGQGTAIPLIGYPQYPSVIHQYDDFNGNHYLGLAFNNNFAFFPSAKFHLKDNLQIDKPLYEAEELTNQGSIKHLYMHNNIEFGIYQSGDGLLNYFEGNIGCKQNLIFDGPHYGISFIENGDHDGFCFTDYVGVNGNCPLKINHDVVKIQAIAECDNFRLINNNAHPGYVLTSWDQDGNAVWANPISINNDWFVNHDEDLYSNPDYRHVGIGFQSGSERVYQRLHVVDGNILISRLHGGAPHSYNGSMLFGDVVDDNCPTGKWGIEYYSQGSNNGLNFWKVYCEGNERTDENNYRLFLGDNGTVGIGTNDTRGYTLGVNGNIICTELKVQLYANWTPPDYVFNKDYKLLPLKEVETYIDKNHHLPDIPSSSELKEKGMNVGEMNSLLLKKIEELTKYIIDQQKQIDELKNKVKSL